jgi:hypothetical protein
VRQLRGNGSSLPAKTAEGESAKPRFIEAALFGRWRTVPLYKSSSGIRSASQIAQSSLLYLFV